MVRSQRAGFTILELMVVVIIVGILASIAVPTFTGYIYKSRVTEATTFLSGIKSRQEAYRSEFGQYCAVDGAAFPTGDTDFTPGTAPSSSPEPWETTDEWDQLGAAPDGPVRFRYATVAGFPGDTVPTGTGLDNNDFWFAAQARGNLDGDSTSFFLEIYSQSNRIYNSAGNEGGWE